MLDPILALLPPWLLITPLIGLIHGSLFFIVVGRRPSSLPVYLALGIAAASLMQALELVKDRKTKEPALAATGVVFEETKRQSVLIGKGGVYGNVIRTGLMLNATKEHADQLADAIDAGLTAAAKM